LNKKLLSLVKVPPPADGRRVRPHHLAPYRIATVSGVTVSVIHTHNMHVDSETTHTVPPFDRLRNSV